MKTILLLAIISSVSWTLCGQSTSPSEQDSTNTVNEFLANSKQILDSLTRFHFVKLELAKERTEKNEWKSNYFSLNTQSIGCKNDLINEKKLVINTKKQLDEQTKNLKNANIEKWIHRIFEIGATIYLGSKL
jgi:hypothetical protein